MPRASTASAQNHAAILSKLPTGATRVQVEDERGKLMWRKLKDVAVTDTIVFDRNNQPVCMTGKPGRPAKVELLPASEVVAEVIRRKKSVVADDDLVVAVHATPDGPEVLDSVMAGLAEEAASLGFEREEAERKGTETSNISIRRVNALKAVGETWLKRKEQLVQAGVDLDSPAFQMVFGLILEALRECLEGAGIRPEMVETVFTRIAKKFDDNWKAEVKRKLKG